MRILVHADLMREFAVRLGPTSSVKRRGDIRNEK
jgi:hypothetical protein